MGVLDEMTKGITQRKAAATGPKLTPVGTEASPTKPSQVGVPDVPEVFLTNEAIRDIAKDLREQAATLIGVADGLDKLTQLDSRGTVDPKVAAAEEQKAAERASDIAAAARAAAKPTKAPKKAPPTSTEEFVEHLATISEEAKAAVFAAADADTEPEPEAPATPVADGWTCPEHGATNIEQLTSRKGRVYWACAEAGCGEFEH